MARTNDDILKLVADQRIEFINLQFTDIVGLVKNVTIPVRQLPDCLDHGVWFDGSSIEGFARIAESDMFLVPDIATYAQIPWDSSSGYPTARLICDVFTPDGKPIRAVAKVKFKASIEELKRAAKENKSSPDLTHTRIVKAGDTLPLMCERIYGEAHRYAQVAKINGLANFRKLTPGQKILFPPIEKTPQKTP